MYFGLRLLTVGVSAAAITAGLFLAMKSLITTNFKVKEKQAVVSFEINPAVEPIDDPIIRTVPEKLKTVETPPAPPVLDRSDTQKPVEAPIKEAELVIEIPSTTIDTGDPIIINIDKDPQPIFRTSPIMPPRADRSGHCIMNFDVSAEGSPFNVAAVQCSQSLFKRASIRSVQGWKYNPQIKNGKAIAYQGLTTKISFVLSDARGQIIPE